MITAIYVLNIISSLALIVIVLLQTGKGADMGAAFGGSSNTVFGGTTQGTRLGKLTAGAAVVFMLTCLFLAYFSSQKYSTGVMKDIDSQTPISAPAPASPAQPAVNLPPMTGEETPAAEPDIPASPLERAMSEPAAPVDSPAGAEAATPSPESAAPVEEAPAPDPGAMPETQPSDTPPAPPEP